jgi:hypothetical protein
MNPLPSLLKNQSSGYQGDIYFLILTPFDLACFGSYTGLRIRVLAFKIKIKIQSLQEGQFLLYQRYLILG